MNQALANKPKAAVVPQEERMVEFKPFMEDESIKLSVSIVQNMLCKPTRNGAVCSAGHAMRFIMLCRARKLNPFEGDAFIVGFDSKDGPEFNLLTAHVAFLKRAEVHPNFDGMESGVVVRDGDGNVVEREGDFTFENEVLLGGWARVHVRDRKIPTYRKLKLGAHNKGRSVWLTDPAGMIVKCAEADALRSTFPNTLGGLYLDGELPEGVLDVVSKPAPEAMMLPEPEQPATASERMTQKLRGKKQPPPKEEEVIDESYDRQMRITAEYASCATAADVERVYTAHCGPDGWCDEGESHLSRECRDQTLAKIMGVSQEPKPNAQES